MPACVTLETQISTVMESLTQAAVAEICKLINSECVEMRLEIRRGQKEIEALKGKIRDLKREAHNPPLVAVSLIEPQTNRRDGGTVHFGPAPCPYLQSVTGFMQFIRCQLPKNKRLQFNIIRIGGFLGGTG